MTVCSGAVEVWSAVIVKCLPDQAEEHREDTKPLPQPYRKGRDGCRLRMEALWAHDGLSMTHFH